MMLQHPRSVLLRTRQTWCYIQHQPIQSWKSPEEKERLRNTVVPQPPHKRKPLVIPELTYEWPFPDFREPQRWWHLKSRFCVWLIGSWGRFILTKLNTLHTHNLQMLNDAIYKRQPGVPLITVANHESCLDDPAVISCLMSYRQLLDQKNMRWALAAHDICFLKKHHTWLMSHGKCAPVVRGMGIHQRGVDFAIERLKEGSWFHIYPEGGINLERQGLYRLKWGIGRIISELDVVPMVIPFWHVGMQNVLPNWPPYYPRTGKKIFLNIGEPIDLTELISDLKRRNASSKEKRKAITDCIQDRMAELRLETLELAKAVGIDTISDEPEPKES